MHPSVPSMSKLPLGDREAVTGAEYVRHLTRHDADRRARDAFRAVALDLAPPGGALFDFGAGTGMDARWFAERGFRVDAYDVDESMCDYFEAECRDLIAAGRVRLERGRYAEFLRRERDGPRADLAISNFAPFSLVDDVAELFAALDRIVKPGGKVLASVLNPYYLAEMRLLGWWRRLPRLWRDGCYRWPGPHRPVIRRRLGCFASASAPYFRLTQVHRGLTSRRGARPPAVDASRPMAWTTALTARFMFLQFEKPLADPAVRT
jgi:SAM-dependent methyltransferase